MFSCYPDVCILYTPIKHRFTDSDGVVLVSSEGSHTEPVDLFENVGINVPGGGAGGRGDVTA